MIFFRVKSRNFAFATIISLVSALASAAGAGLDEAIMEQKAGILEIGNYSCRLLINTRQWDLNVEGGRYLDLSRGFEGVFSGTRFHVSEKGSYMYYSTIDSPPEPSHMEITTAFDGEHQARLDVLNNYLERDLERSPPEVMPSDLFLNYRGVPVHEHLGHPDAKVLGTEVVSGIDCTLVEVPVEFSDGSVNTDGVYRFWLAENRRWYPVRMEYTKGMNDGTPYVISSVQTTKIGETESGLFYPLEAKSMMTTIRNGKRVKAAERTITCEVFTPNIPVWDEMFVIDTDKSVTVQDRVIGLTYKSDELRGVRLDQLDKLVDSAQEKNALVEKNAEEIENYFEEDSSPVSAPLPVAKSKKRIIYAMISMMGVFLLLGISYSRGKGAQK